MRLLRVVTALLIGTIAVATPAASNRSSATGNVRALWVTRASLATPESVAQMVRSARDAGFNALLVQVRGRGEAYYRSRIEPRAAELVARPDFDPLALALTLAREAGIAVHAWVNVNLVSSAVSLPRDRSHVVWRHPEWLMVPRPLLSELAGISPRSPAFIGTLSRWTQAESARVEGLYLSPVLPASRAYTVSVIRELVAEYPVDGVHLDYVRYPHEDFDYSAGALEGFRALRAPLESADERAALDRARGLSPAAWTLRAPAAWSEFRRDVLTALVAEVQAAVREARPGVQVTAAVVPSAAEARERKLQDWPVWARAGYLDAVCPMVYTTSEAEFARAMGDFPALAGATPVWAGIGAYRLSIDQSIRRIELARAAGAAGVVLFSYDKLSESGPQSVALARLGPVLQAPLPPASAGGGR